MRWWLSQEKKVAFDAPESFSQYDSQRDCWQEKLSEAIIEASTQDDSDRHLPRFSKSLHTPDLLQDVQVDLVQKKCPLFQELYFCLKPLNSP